MLKKCKNGKKNVNWIKERLNKAMMKNQKIWKLWKIKLLIIIKELKNLWDNGLIWKIKFQKKSKYWQMK